MTDSQWIYYFASELGRLAPHVSADDAIEFARGMRATGEPEVQARSLVSSLSLLRDGLQTRRVRQARRSPRTPRVCHRARRAHHQASEMTMHQATILIVDDNPENLMVLGESLRGVYRVLAANSGERALQIAANEPAPDLVLLDVMMPGLNGYEVLRRLQASPRTAAIPVIFATAMDAEQDERRGLAMGAVDYIVKPLRPAIVQARVRTQLELKHAREKLERRNGALEQEVSRRMRETLAIQEVTIRALARLAETRDNETGNHILRTQEYVHALALRARRHPRFAAELTDAAIRLMAKSAPLHDIGKVGIPDAILLKPGRLTDDERRVMMTHARLGAEALSRAAQDAQQPIGFLAYASEIARSHHERWDGSGYPDGLAGNAVPLSARIMAIADVFDALISRRVYKRPMAPGEARELMAHERGRHFDPELLDIFMQSFDDFCLIAARYPDQAAEVAP